VKWWSAWSRAPSGVAGVQTQRLFVACGCGLPLLKHKEYIAARRVGVGKIRFQRERAIEMGRCVTEIATLAEQCAKQITRVGIVRIEFQRVAVTAFRGRPLP
jgi:hypothetical protein